MFADEDEDLAALRDAAARLGDAPLDLTAVDALLADIVAHMGTKHDRLLQRVRVVARNPGLAGRAARVAGAAYAVLAQELAHQRQRQADDLACRVVAGVVIGTITTSVWAWRDEDGARPFAVVAAEAAGVLRTCLGHDGSDPVSPSPRPSSLPMTG